MPETGCPISDHSTHQVLCGHASCITDISYILTGYVSGTSSGPSACPPPAGRASQVSSCSVRQILPAAACRETAHDRDRLWRETGVGRSSLRRGCLAAGLPPAGARARAGLFPCRFCPRPARGALVDFSDQITKNLPSGCKYGPAHFLAASWKAPHF